MSQAEALVERVAALLRIEPEIRLVEVASAKPRSRLACWLSERPGRGPSLRAAGRALRPAGLGEGHNVIGERRCAGNGVALARGMSVALEAAEIPTAKLASFP
jgi:hypothetical protein